MIRLPVVLRYIAVTILILLALAAAVILIVTSNLIVLFTAAHAAAPEQFAVYNVCKSVLGDISFSYRAADDSFLIRCPRESEPRIVIKNCRGSLSFDNSYNVIVACPDGRRIPIVRGAYPR